MSHTGIHLAYLRLLPRNNHRSPDRFVGDSIIAGNFSTEPTLHTTSVPYDQQLRGINTIEINRLIIWRQSPYIAQLLCHFYSCERTELSFLEQQPHLLLVYVFASISDQSIEIFDREGSGICNQMKQMDQ
jgi:hypothetical protein